MVALEREQGRLRKGTHKGGQGGLRSQWCQLPQRQRRWQTRKLQVRRGLQKLKAGLMWLDWQMLQNAKYMFVLKAR